MQHRRKVSKGVIFYIISDFVLAGLGWFLFFFYRKFYIQRVPFSQEFFADVNLQYGLIIIPIIWLMLYILLDSYRNLYRMSRMKELVRTFVASILGTLLIFFTFLLDDLQYYPESYQNYYQAFFGLFGIHFVMTVGFRLTVLTLSSWQIKSGKVGFRTLIVGSNQKAVSLYQEITAQKKSTGYDFIGYVTIDPEHPNGLSEHLEHLGGISDLSMLIQEYQIQEVILALEKSEHERTKSILNILERHHHNILIKVIPDMYDILLGNVKMNHVYGAILIEISPHFIQPWLKFTKRGTDILTSLLVLVLFSPIYIFIALRVRLSSKGSIFYKQERIGLYGEPFMIYKFRSMYTNAEKLGPQLSSDSDSRITPWGKIMRKYRLDELPQFWNVLKGDMSLVGPRPERQFYVDQIAEHAPHVYQLHKVRPGITSWGQVKYGYASDVGEMVQRLKYDILYIENLSYSLDIKILFYTVLVIVQGRGK
ncbi:MAG: sugar transferase [Saprospiraceae bacterium]|nr:sugar transferase [Saprospiraceae bacterium]